VQGVVVRASAVVWERREESDPQRAGQGAGKTGGVST